jgi:hypothetical protein
MHTKKQLGKGQTVKNHANLSNEKETGAQDSVLNKHFKLDIW